MSTDPMMTKAEKDVVSMVYRRFIESEYDDYWTDLDEKLYELEWLTDKETVIESMVKYAQHSRTGTVFRCKREHSPQECFSPYILQAVESILLLYEETKDLHPKNKYVLAFYLAMSEVGLIFSVSEDESKKS